MIVKRDFIVGDEWFYVKIYCGYETADLILLNFIKPLIVQLKKDKIIDLWFFIRYNDPESHLRLRFHLTNIEKIGLLIQYFNQYCSSCIENNYTWKIQIDTYTRETERYNSIDYSLTEKIFHFDSEMIMEYLNYRNELNDKEKIIFSCLSIIHFLDVLGLSIFRKREIISNMLLGYIEEHNADKFILKKMNLVWHDIENLLNDIVKNFKIEKLLSLKDVSIGKLSLESNNLSLNYISSHIHMMINRQFQSRQREYETLIYFILEKMHQEKLYNKKLF